MHTKQNGRKLWKLYNLHLRTQQMGFCKTTKITNCTCTHTHTHTQAHTHTHSHTHSHTLTYTHALAQYNTNNKDSRHTYALTHSHFNSHFQSSSQRQIFAIDYVFERGGTAGKSERDHRVRKCACASVCIKRVCVRVGTSLYFCNAAKELNLNPHLK